MKNLKRSRIFISSILTVALAISLTGCNGQSKKTGSDSTNKVKKINVGYFGNTCEAPIFAAYEKGFFKEEGLEVEMVKGDANTLKDGLATGKVDITDGLVMQWLKPIESGLDIKFTAGLHTGCIQVLTPPNSNIKSFKELKGKKIGVSAIGGGAMILASRLLTLEGLDSQKDVEWKVFPNSELPIALEKGEVDVISVSDPFAQIQINSGKAKSMYNSAKDAPFKDEYCCLTVVNGKLIEKDPETAAAATRAIMKGAKYVSENPKEIAKIEVEKKYVPGDVEVNASILASYNYIPSIKGGADAVNSLSKEMKKLGLLNKDTDAEALAKSSFVKLKGVN